MNKKDLAAALSESIGSTKKDATAIVENIIDIMSNTLSNGEDVDLYGFGKFKLAQRKAYTARNPQTGEPIEVPEKRVVSFKASKKLKDGVVIA